MTIAVVAVARALASPTDPHPMSMLLQRCDTALANIGVTDGLWTERDRGYLRSCADCDSTNLPTMIVLSVGLGVTVACSSPTVAPVPRVAVCGLTMLTTRSKALGSKNSTTSMQSARGAPWLIRTGPLCRRSQLLASPSM